VGLSSASAEQTTDIGWKLEARVDGVILFGLNRAMFLVNYFLRTPEDCTWCCVTYQSLQ